MSWPRVSVVIPTLAVLRRHGPVKVAEAVKIESLGYDWTLNDKRPPDARAYGMWELLRDRLTR